MLVLTRKREESIVIQGSDGPIVVKLVGISGGRAKLGIDAPDHVRIDRSELLDQEQQRDLQAESLRRFGKAREKVPH